MNKVELIGRLTRDPEVHYSGETCIARYSLAVDRRFKRENEPDADFINCVVFGKGGEFAEKYLSKGIKIAVTGRIQTGSYTNKEGNKVYTTDVIVEEQEFCEKKSVNEAARAQAAPPPMPTAQTAPPPMPQNVPQQQAYQQPVQQPVYNTQPQQMYQQPTPQQYYQAPQQPYYQPQQPQRDSSFVNIPEAVAADEIPFE